MGHSKEVCFPLLEMKKHSLDNPLGRNVIGQIEYQMRSRTRILLDSPKTPKISILLQSIAVPAPTNTVKGRESKKKMYSCHPDQEFRIHALCKPGHREHLQFPESVL